MKAEIIRQLNGVNFDGLVFDVVGRDPDGVYLKLEDEHGNRGLIHPDHVRILDDEDEARVPHA